MGEHEARHAIGQRRLADAGRPADQPGMRQAPAAIGLEQRPLGLGVAEQYGGLRAVTAARRSSSASAAAALTMPRPRASTGAVAGSSRLLHDVPDALGDLGASARWRRSARSGRARAAPAAGRRRAASHGSRSSRASNRSASPSPRRLARPRKPDLGRHVEDEGQVGLEVADGHPFERPGSASDRPGRACPDRPWSNR